MIWAMLIFLEELEMFVHFYSLILFTSIYLDLRFCWMRMEKVTQTIFSQMVFFFHGDFHPMGSNP